MNHKKRERKKLGNKKYPVIDDRPVFAGELRVDGRVVWSGRKLNAEKILGIVRKNPKAVVAISWHLVRGTLIARTSLSLPRREE